jgi:plasmid stabilization system protein ParE
VNQVRFTQWALDDLERLFDHYAAIDLTLVRRANEAVKRAIRTLEDFPFSGRMVDENDPFIREFVISFGNAGYVVLFEIENEHWVTILAIRHQRESDYQ